MPTWNKRYVSVVAEELTKQRVPVVNVTNVDRTNKGKDISELTIYGVTLVNLLGKYGNFETDSNSDGLADGWVGEGENFSLVSGLIGSYAQQVYEDNSSGTSNVFPQLSRTIYTISENDVIFVRCYGKLNSDHTALKPILAVSFKDINNEELQYVNLGTINNTSWTLVYGKCTAPASTYSAIIKSFDNKASVGTIASWVSDGVAVYNLTKMGALPEPLQELYGVQNWADLDADTLAQLLPYVDSVASVGYTFNDGTLTVMVENRGKNLFKGNWYKYSGANTWGLYKDGIVFYSTTSNDGVYAKDIYLKPGTYTISATVISQIGMPSWYVQDKRTLSYVVRESITSSSKTFTITEAGEYRISFEFYHEGDGEIYVYNVQLEENSSASIYESPRSDGVSFTTELHGFEGKYDILHTTGSKIKHFTRETGVTFTYDSGNDVSTATVSSSAIGTAIIVNESNGEVFFGNASGTTITVSGDLSVGTYTVIYRKSTVTTSTIEVFSTMRALTETANHFVASQAKKDTFMGDGVTTTFTLSSTANSTSYKVYVSGVEVTEGIVKTTTSFTFDEAPKRGAIIEAVYNEQSVPVFVASLELYEPSGAQENISYLTDLTISENEDAIDVRFPDGTKKRVVRGRDYTITLRKDLIENYSNFIETYRNKVFRLLIQNTRDGTTEYAAPCRIEGTSKDYLNGSESVNIWAGDLYD